MVPVNVMTNNDRYTERIQPWLHYVPVSLDYSDLLDTFVFFRGDLSGNRNHDELAKKIAYAGSKWAYTFYRDEDATAYMFRQVTFQYNFHFCVISSKTCRLMLEYARIMSVDRDAMSFKLH